MPLTAKLTEAAFTRQVIQLARLRGWRVAHFRPAMNRRGQWATAMSGDVGWPDLFLARGDVAWAVELKVGRNKPTAEQAAWLAALDAAGVAVAVWTPDEWPRIEGALM